VSHHFLEHNVNIFRREISDNSERTRIEELMSWQEEGVPRAPRPAEEGVPRAPRPAVAVPPTPANYVPQSLRPSQSAGALVGSGEDESQVRI
jgi:hypothetical protein